MPTSRSLRLWFVVAVGLHLVLYAITSAAHLPELVEFYGVIVAYAVPAALGLALGLRWPAWKAVVWAAAVIAAHSLAVFVFFSTKAPFGLSSKGSLGGFNLIDFAAAGAAAGLVGASLSLFALMALMGVRPRLRTLGLAVGASIGLAALGAGLCPLLVETLDTLQAFAVAVVLYLPWQIVFSLAVVAIAVTRPAR
jgi:hypothetical protein